MVTFETGYTTPTMHLESKMKARSQSRVTRVSTLEVAIRAQAKRFLAHPYVVQQLEAIWAGGIVFHSASDNLHRVPSKNTRNGHAGYGTGGTRPRPSRRLQQSAKGMNQPESVLVRRSVTLYDPQDASLFKLSRLRVPRYRQFLSTCSFAILLGLYVAVLFQRSSAITLLEVVFWFWSAGYLLDEVVGFNEQGFGLYIMSVWNAFDLGILLLLIVYYGLRLYGILIPEPSRHDVVSMAYDVLAATAVLLFPRLFNALDHYRYFSQLLIAFRLMAIDLVAVLVLIMISCSGFFVAFALSFGKDEYNFSGVAYFVFQMLLGFTPAAWNVWPDYNILGKILLTLFLFVCHFLIVTILITVLTNSFMAIVANANEEHQFLLAVNTISLVKSDALFSYIAPANIIGWLLTPLRSCIQMRTFVKLNRTVIKVTHFPVLFGIYLFERIRLGSVLLEDALPRDDRRRAHIRTLDHGFRGAGVGLFSSPGRLRTGSQLQVQKDQALEEVFRRPLKNTTMEQGQAGDDGSKRSRAVSTWMRGIGSEGRASPPLEQERSTVDQHESRRSMARQRPNLTRRLTSLTRDFTRSIHSDPEDLSIKAARTARRSTEIWPAMDLDEEVGHAEAEVNDELVIEDEEESASLTRRSKQRRVQLQSLAEDGNFSTLEEQSRQPSLSGIVAKSSQQSGKKRGTDQTEKSCSDHSPSRRRFHLRNVSSATILYNPIEAPEQDAVLSTEQVIKRYQPVVASGSATARTPGYKSPKQASNATTRPLPVRRSQTDNHSAPNTAVLGMIDGRHSATRYASSLALESTSDLNDDVALHSSNLLGAVPSSFATQMALATGAVRTHPGLGGEDSAMMTRLVLARMNALEEGFRDLIQEVKDMRREGSAVGKFHTGKRA